MSSFMGIFRPKFLGVLLLGLFILGLDASDAQANSGWKQLQGHSACGGVDKAGNLQEPCDFQKATYVRPSIKTCPKGSFADLGSCWDCPTGYNRSVRKVTHERACQKNVPDKTGPATFLGAVKCPSGSFKDGRNGGECWSCPAGFGRTATKVDAWNACGKIGKKATSAIFKGRQCPDQDAFRDPRNGGECWKCPEDYNRTANAVTGARACKTSFAFKPAINKGDRKCEPNQIFDLIDGGTCWTCPEGAKRTWFSIKSAKACRNNKMQWVLPDRQKYGLFGLGSGADDILAKIIAERTALDAQIKKAAKLGGKDPAAASKVAWEVIDNRPWESPYLSAALGAIVMDAAAKPAAQRTESEKQLMGQVAQLIQWNRQFIAYQAKQAHQTWEISSKKAYEISAAKMGAAIIYSDSMVTPPDYNEMLVGAVQVAAGFAGPAGSVLIPLFVKPVQIATFPFREAARKLAAQAAKKVVETAVKAGGGATAWTSSSVAMASLGPLMIVAAAGIIVTMEIDKFMALEKAAGKIQQSIDIANRPLDLNIFLQQQTGPDEFLFHWAAVIGADTRPSANFKTRLAAYKAGKDPDAKPTALIMPTINFGGITNSGQNTPSSDTIAPGSVTITPIQSTSVVVENPLLAPAPTAEKALIAAIKRQKTQPSGTLRFELTNAPGLCLSKSEGPTEAMALADCNQQDTLWIRPNEKPNALVFHSKYCVGVGDAKLQDRIKVLISKCQTTPNMQWELQADGHVKMLKADFCMAVIDKPVKGAEVLLQKCSGNRARQIWRPWVVAP
ncbi:MAG TPA: hypothetical protein DC046_08505 [Rhodospirillaceae bacterium]|nr:hypothetical protein [Rhodospirillaceae bacterium]